MLCMIKDISPDDVVMSHGLLHSSARVHIPCDLSDDGLAVLYVSSTDLERDRHGFEESVVVSSDGDDWFHMDMKIKPSEFDVLGARTDVMACENLGSDYNAPELVDVRVKMMFSDIAEHVNKQQECWL